MDQVQESNNVINISDDEDMEIAVAEEVIVQDPLAEEEPLIAPIVEEQQRFEFPLPPMPAQAQRYEMLLPVAPTPTNDFRFCRNERCLVCMAASIQTQYNMIMRDRLRLAAMATASTSQQVQPIPEEREILRIPANLTVRLVEGAMALPPMPPQQQPQISYADYDTATDDEEYDEDDDEDGAYSPAIEHVPEPNRVLEAVVRNMEETVPETGVCPVCHEGTPTITLIKCEHIVGCDRCLPGLTEVSGSPLLIFCHVCRKSSEYIKGKLI